MAAANRAVSASASLKSLEGFVETMIASLRFITEEIVLVILEIV